MFLVSCAVLVFQVVQTRILSVIAWYYLAFVAISVAMLGMTAGAVWVYLEGNEGGETPLALTIADATRRAAVAMPLSLLVQLSLITTIAPTLTSVVAWALLMGAMTVPYVYAGMAVSLALTRSPFPVPLVYGVDLLGAAAGCAAVIGILNVLDGPSAVLFAGLLAAGAAFAFHHSASGAERERLRHRLWQRPWFTVAVLALAVPVNVLAPVGVKPLMVKDAVERGWESRTERWNSYSRIVAFRPFETSPDLWGPSPYLPNDLLTRQAPLNIDGAAGTLMYHFDGTRESIDFLKYDVVNLAYSLPGIRKAAVIGVGGGRDLLSAHLFGVPDITGVELNQIFIDLHTRDPFYSSYSNLTAVPGVRLVVDDARAWFAATSESFDLVQMSLIDTWAATGAGAFSLSENGLYTLEGWRAFTRRLTDRGIFTVSRWYNPGDVNESGRMIALAMATLVDAGATEPRRHLFVARVGSIATLVLAKQPFTAAQLDALRVRTREMGFAVLIDPEEQPQSGMLRAILASRSIEAIDHAGAEAALDLTVPTDNRPFFFNQLRFRDIPRMIGRLQRQQLLDGVLRGNLTASIALVLILIIALVAVVFTILLPLRATAGSATRRLVLAGTTYFGLIGLGFMFAEISLLQYFSVFLGHPIYAMGVCLFSLILSTGVGSLASAWFPLTGGARFAGWALLLTGYLYTTQAVLTRVFAEASAQTLAVRVAVALAIIFPGGFLMGFGFPTGMMLVERVDRRPTPWFWGINGATGVLASVIAVMIGMAWGINVTMLLAACCYLALLPASRALRSMPASGTPPRVR